MTACTSWDAAEESVDEFPGYDEDVLRKSLMRSFGPLESSVDDEMPAMMRARAATPPLSPRAKMAPVPTKRHSSAPSARPPPQPSPFDARPMKELLTADSVSAPLPSGRQSVSTARPLASVTTISPLLEYDIGCKACASGLLLSSMRNHWRTEKHRTAMRTYTNATRFCSLTCGSNRTFYTDWVTAREHMAARARFPQLEPVTRLNHIFMLCKACGGVVVTTVNSLPPV